MLQPALEDLNRVVIKMEALRDAAKAEAAVLDKRLKVGLETETQLQSLKEYVDRFTDEYQHRVIAFVEQLVSDGLHDVFDESLAFVVVQKERNNQVTYDFVIRDAYAGVEVDPITGKGGGCVEVVAVLLRVILLYLNRHRLRQVLVFDENLSHLALEYVPQMASLLRGLADKLGMQIILVTHQTGFVDAADTVVRVKKVNGIAVFNITQSGKTIE